MILIVDFVYASQNGVLENFLNDIALEAKIEFFITKNGNTISLHTRAEEETLKSFAEDLAVKLPHSIFLRTTSARVSENWESQKAITVQQIKVELPITPKLLAEAKNSANAEIDAIAERLTNNEKIATDYGYTVQLLSDREFDHSAVIVPSDIALIAKYAVVKDEEIAALASLERPIVTLPANMIFSAKYPNAPKLIRVALAGDIFLYQLLERLGATSIDEVVLTNYDHIEVRPLSRQNLVLNRNNFCAPQLLKELGNIKEQHYNQFASALIENDLTNSSTIGVYLSRKNSDFIMFNSQKTGVVDLVKLEIAENMQTIFDRIGAIDENSAKLIDRYAQTDHYNAIKDDRFLGAEQSIYTLWTIAAKIIGISIGELEELIAFSSTPKGPRIDYKIENGKIDPYRFLRSVISYLTADVDRELIAFGIVESLVFAISDLLDTLSAGDYNTKSIILCGSLFSNKTLSEMAIKHISPNYTVLFNNELPID
ncbi:hypothetical protein AGMMS50229_14350 [Campylobacterota bacterium]|nr:hypothetical protein AGMMS50229_14350 [Campylobacterota bacterium]